MSEVTTNSVEQGPGNSESHTVGSMIENREKLGWKQDNIATHVQSSFDDVKAEINRRIMEDSQKYQEQEKELLEKDASVNSRYHFQVFIAKYNYDPVHLSPNENPDAELAFIAGDYLFIYGEMDEDGYYEGELMDGRKGLVPSNFIEKVPADDLKEPDLSLMSRTLLDDLDEPWNSANDWEDNGKIFDVGIEQKEPIVTISEFLDKSETEVVSPPLDLHQERQLSCSYVIAWSPPDENLLPSDMVHSYDVFCDDQLVTTVAKGDRTKALLERLDISKSHKVCVRTVTPDGRRSSDHQCTITIGKGARYSPSAVEVFNIAKRSAVASWSPASSYVEHQITVDDQWEGIIKPGVNKCLIKGLQPSTSHTVCIRCIENQVTDQNIFSASASFITLPKDFPDPPTDVQVDIGPRHGTLLVTWIPVVKDGDADLVMTHITGYTVYIDGNKVKQLSSPTVDHVILDSNSFTFTSNPHQVTVRTSTVLWESPDSQPPVVLSEVLIQELGKVPPITSSKTAGNASENKASIDSTDANAAEKKAEEKKILDDVNIGKHGTDKSLKQTTADLHADVKHQTDSNRRPARLPQIEITKDSLSDSSFDNYSEYDVEVRRISASVKQRDGKDQKVREQSPRSKSEQSQRSKSDQSPRSKSEQSSRGKSEQSPRGKSEQSPRSGRSEHSRNGMHDGTKQRGDVSDKICKNGKSRQGNKSNITDIVVVEGIDADATDSLVGSSEVEYDNSQVRLFIALFDYNPASMSPNNDAADEELPFCEGQLLKVIGDKDSDGFYYGESNGMRGLVPSNMVTEVLVDNPLTAEQLLKDSLTLCRGKHKVKTSLRDHSKGHRQVIKEQKEDAVKTAVPSGSAGPPCKMVAIYNYNPHELSPKVDAEVELSFKTGDIILVYGNVDVDGFYHGELDGRRGLVPSNFLRPLTMARQSDSQRSQHQRPSTDPQTQPGKERPYRDQRSPATGRQQPDLARVAVTRDDGSKSQSRSKHSRHRDPAGMVATRSDPQTREMTGTSSRRSDKKVPMNASMEPGNIAVSGGQ